VDRATQYRAEGGAAPDSEIERRRGGSLRGILVAFVIFELLCGVAIGGVALWRLYATNPHSYVTTTHAAWDLVVLISVTVALMMAFTAGLYRCIAGPIRRLSGALERATSSGPVRSVATDGPRELANLATRFNEMVAVRDAVQERLSHEGLHDHLTDLPNRVLFMDRLELALQRKHRSGRGVAVMALNVDRFKVLVDSAGHDAGDDALVILAGRLCGAVRRGDTVARLGGDGFAVLCEDLGQDSEAVDLATSIQRSVRDLITVAGRDVRLSVSVGLALADGDDTAAELLRDADSAMYRAKAHRSGSIDVADEGLRQRAAARAEIEAEMDLGLRRREFVVYYQPVVGIDDGRVVGVEALVRWRHPERGLVAPAEFIDVAEESGLIVPLGSMVLESACRQLTEWTRGGLQLTVSVNVSPCQLIDPDFYDTVVRILQRTGAPPDGLCLELTETALVGEDPGVLGLLWALRAIGVHLCIDDFGTGYSSLSYLQHLPVETMKIDRSFVRTLGDSGSLIVGALVRMAEGLNLVAVAEGVENEYQLQELRRLGCSLAQGFYFARPQMAQPMTQLLSQDLESRAASR
jgi:diguanylate cyclase (GGDEF)-like protein